MAPEIGRIVEFLIDEAPRLGVITSEMRDKLQVTDAFGRRHSINVRTVLVFHQESADLLRPGPRIQETLAKIEELTREIDTELLWESIPPGGQSLKLEKLALLYFGEADCCRFSALFRAMMGDPLRFKVKGTSVQARTSEQVEAQEIAARRQFEKEDLRRRIRGWFAGILAGGSGAGGTGEDELSDEEKDSVVRRLQNFLLQRQKDEELDGWLDRLDADLTPRMVAYDVLASLGRLPAAADPLLIAAGIDPRFSREAGNLVSELLPFASEPWRQKGAGVVVSIDDEDTREIDDAFSLEVAPDGYTVSVYIADLGPFVRSGDALDQEGRRRVTSIYLPHTTVRMLPERLSCDLASLRSGELRPAMALMARFDPDFELLGWEFAQAEICVTHRLSYDEADRVLASETTETLSDMLQWLQRLASRLASRRALQGALRINRPEVKIVARGDSVSLKVVDPASPSRKMVSELMILMNTLAAQAAAAAGIPFIYRSQPPPAKPLVVPEVYDPVKMNEILSLLEKSRLSTVPEPHSGLGLASYTQLTSPIRRFSDLVLQRQLTAWNRGEALPYSPEELMELISVIQPVDADVRAAERNANRFYTLTYLAQNGDSRTFPAVVLRPLERGGFLVETQDYFIRGMLPKKGDLVPGSPVEVAVEQVIPSRGVLVFRAVG